MYISYCLVLDVHVKLSRLPKETLPMLQFWGLSCKQILRECKKTSDLSRETRTLVDSISSRDGNLSHGTSSEMLLLVEESEDE